MFSATFVSRVNIAILSYSIISSVTFFLFYVYNAADVALTEISIGVFITFFFFYLAHSKTSHVQTSSKVKPLTLIVAGLSCFGVFCLMMYTALLLESITLVTEYSHYYNQHSYAETHIANIVTAILASYRAFDTLGETLIIATSSFGVLAILKQSTHSDSCLQKI